MDSDVNGSSTGKDLVHKCISDPGRGKPSSEEEGKGSRHRSSPTSSDGASSTRKCVLTLDGYSYVIVASPPGSAGGSSGISAGTLERRVVSLRDEKVSVGPPNTAKTRAQLPKQGSLTIVRRSSNSGGRRSPGSAGGCGGRQGPPWNSPPSSIDLEGPSSGTSSPLSSMTMAIAPSETDSVTGAVNLATENLPAVDTPDACDKAALRLRGLLCQLQNGEVSVEVLQRNLQYAAKVLEAVYIDETRTCRIPQEDLSPSPQDKPSATTQTTASTATSHTQTQNLSAGAPTAPAVSQRRRLREPVWARRLADEDDELSEVQPDAVPPEVREWLASTFTRQMATTKRKADEKPKFRSVAHAIRAGIFVDRMYRRIGQAALMQFPTEVAKVLKHLDDWCFDVFALSEASGGQPVKYLGYDLLNRYGMIHKFKVPPAVLETFLVKVEEGYCKYGNPYHNNIHAADVSQTVHFMLCQTGLMNWMTDLEIFATLIAALIHDYEHTGTTNNFHVMSGSDTALMYNDRAVLENLHLSLAFQVMKDEDSNVAQNLSREEYREFRTLIIDMVLATDMSCHFQQLKNMRNLLSLAEPSIDKSKALSMVLHTCDISHPSKIWSLHKRWTTALLEEFFRQGDMEKELGLPFSPLCDRNNTLVAESQIGFIEFIVEPSMSLCGDMLEAILAPPDETASAANNTNATNPSTNSGSTTGSAKSATPETCCPQQTKRPSSSSSTGSSSSNPDFRIPKPWTEYLAENKASWKEQAAKEAAERAQQKEEEEAANPPKEAENPPKEAANPPEEVANPPENPPAEE